MLAPSRPVRVYASQLYEMTLCEWKLREQSTVFGFLWTLLHPLLMFLVLYSLFTKWMGGQMSDYASFLLIGIVQFGFFNMGTNYALSSLSRRSGVLTNFVLPRELIVLAGVLSVAASYLLEFLVMLVFVLALGASVSASWLFLPVIYTVYIVLVTGISLVLAVLAARYPDWERIWAIISQALFFLTPVFYTLKIISPQRRRFLWFNPLTHVIEMTRAAIMEGRWPSAREFGALAIASALVAIGGYVLFKRAEPHLADYVAV